MTPKQMIKLKASIIEISNISVLLGKYNPDSAEYLSYLKQLGSMQQNIFDYIELLVEVDNDRN